MDRCCHVRRASADHAPAIASVLHDAFIRFRPLYTEAAFAATVVTATELRRRMSEGPVWVVVRRGAIIGTVGAICKSQGLYIRGMAVAPSVRRRGIARRLLQEAERFAEGGGQTRVFLSTTPFLDAAIRLYESAGYRRTAEGPHDLYGTPLFTIAKALGR